MALSKITNLSITDDAVRTVGIQDNNVTLAKLGDGTQGDILYYGASGAPARLGFGTSGDFLKTQGTGANPVWASAGGDNTPAFLAYQGSDQTSLASGSTTKIEYGTEIFATDSTYDHSTNYRWTPAVVGKYAIGCSGAMGVNTGERIALMVYKNGSSVLRAQSGFSGANGDQFSIAGVIDVTSTSDYFEGYIYNGSSGAKGLSGGESICRFWGYKLIT